MLYRNTTKIIFSTIAIYSGLFSPLAFSQTGEAVVNFVGTIQEAGCQIDTSTKDQAIDFGTVGVNAFSTSAGYAISLQPIYIKLINCPGTISIAKTTFNGTAMSGDARFLAINSGEGAATGLGIGFRGMNGNPISINNSGGSGDAGQPLVAGNNTLHYTTYLTNIKGSGYLPVDAGTINSTATYSIEYQ